MAADEKGTHARLTTLRKDFIEPKIAEHHGRIVKLMGDGALVEFASVVDAVECAAAIQSGVAERQANPPADQRIAFRIGINIGDVIIEEGDIYGAGVGELLLAAYGYLGGRDGDIQAMRDRLAGTWGDHIAKVRTIVAMQPLKEPRDAGRFAEGLRRAGQPEY
jgi:hypothetical protein